jgi:hypothetical protein
VKIRSPGSSVQCADAAATSSEAEKMRSLERPCCSVSPFSRQTIGRSSMSSNSSVVTTNGPSGANESYDFAIVNWLGPSNWAFRSEMSWPAVTPTT